MDGRCGGKSTQLGTNHPTSHILTRRHYYAFVSVPPHGPTTRHAWGTGGYVCVRAARGECLTSLGIVLLSARLLSGSPPPPMNPYPSISSRRSRPTYQVWRRHTLTTANSARLGWPQILRWNSARPPSMCLTETSGERALRGLDTYAVVRQQLRTQQPAAGPYVMAWFSGQP